MPGVIYRALPKTPYDFSTVSTGSSQLYIVAKAIDASAYREAIAVVRLHAVSINNATTPSIAITVWPEAPTTEDPALDFVTTPAVSTTTMVLSPNLTAPQLALSTLTTPFGGFLRVQLSGNQPAAVARATVFQVTLSIDIVAKS